MENNTLQNALNEFSQGTTDNIDSIMIKDANGNQYWIKKADLASVLGGLLSNKLFLPYTISPKYNENLDNLKGNNARTVISPAYNSTNPDATPSPTNQWAVVDTDYYPVGGYTRQILTSWFSPKNRMIRYYDQEGSWSNWVNL